MKLNKMDPTYHQAGQFREQIATLSIGSVDEQAGTITLLRSYYGVCLAGAASWDLEKPGADTPNSWKVIDDLISNQGVRGVFHTHPAGILDFSSQDWSNMVATAQAEGDKMLWYGVQSIDSKMAHFVCLQMLNKRVFVYDQEWHEQSPTQLSITLSLPIKVNVESGCYRINC